MLIYDKSNYFTNPKPNLNMTQNPQTKIQTLKSLTTSITLETKDQLCGIKSACDIIRDNLDDAIRFIELITLSSSRGLLFADMVLHNINDEEIDKSSFKNLSITTVVENALSKYLFKNKEEIELINANYDNDFIFLGDETLMSFVILNLLKNALIYKARIDIWFDSKQKCLYFKDAGVGIAAEKLANIFNEQKAGFTKSDQRRERDQQQEKPTNIGLGLLFCKRVMKAFGGDISVKSELGKRTEFCLWF